MPYSQNTYIEASAGTGKTYRIVEIVEELLKSNTKLTEIVIVTFTEKAAGELKDRIRKKIETSYANEQSLATKEIFLQARKDLSFASIGTIHQFCRSILSRNFMSAGISPDYEEITDMKTKRWEIFYPFFSELENEFVKSGRKEDLINLLMEISFEDLQSLCFLVADKTGGKKLYRTNLEPIESSFENSAKELCKLLQDSLLSEKIPLELEDLKKCLLGTIDYSQATILLTSKPFTKSNTLNKTLVGKKMEESEQTKINELAEKVYKLSKILYDYKRIGLTLEEVLDRFIKHYKEYKNSKNYLTTNEIILSARDILVSKNGKPKLENWKYVIVDECQDTDPIQLDLFAKLDAQLKHLVILMVGDKKQSIYRFRNADLSSLEQFLKKMKFIGEEGEKKQKIEVLDTSYRSSPSLVKVMNLIFSKIKPLNYTPIKDRYEKGGENPYTNYAPFLYTMYEGEEKIDSKIIMEFSSKSIIDCIQKIIQNPDFQIIPKEESNGKAMKREIRYSDIAIFASSRDKLRQLLQALKSAKIPAGIYKEETFFESSIVACLSYLLHTIENPLDSTSLYRTLASDLFLVENSLLIQVFPSGDVSYLRPLPSDTKFNELRKIFHSLAKAHEDRYQYSASFLIQRILEEQDILPRLSSGFEGRRNLTNIYHFLEILNRLQFESKLSFGSIAREIRQNVEQGTKEKEKIDFDEFSKEENSVKLMTIHSSKGLEFPVCMLFGFAGGANRSEPIDCHIEDEFKTLQGESIGIQYKCKGFSSLGWEESKKIQEKLLEEEAYRLFYVALTRAREYIFFPIISLSANNKSNLNQIVDLLFWENQTLMQEIKKENLSLEITSYNRNQGVAKEEKLEVDTPVINIQELYRKSEKKIINEKNSYRRIVSYSSLHSKQVKPEQQTQKPKEKTENQDSSEGATFGKLCHKVLEIIPLEAYYKPDDYEDLINLICEKEFRSTKLHDIPGNYNLQTLKDLTFLALKGEYPTITEKSSPAKWKYISRERKFFEKGESIGDYLLGIGDLFFYFDGKYYILDWKSDLIPDDTNLEELEKITFDKYRNQIFIYSWCILKNLCKGKILSSQELEEIYSEQFGGMIYVFLRRLQKGNGSLLIKPNWEELYSFIHYFQEEKLA